MMKKLIYPILLMIILLIVSLNILSIYNIPLLGIRVFKVGSGSMEPYLKVNSLIVVKESNNYKLNDVITYKDQIGYVTHRIIDVKDNQIITKGDANNTKDDPITKDEVIGKVILKLNFFNIVNYIISKPIIWTTILVIGGLFIYLIPSKNN